MRTEESISQENIYMAATLGTGILLNSWQKEHFDLPLLAKQNISSHIIALEESYQEFFISKLYIPSSQKIFDEYTISQYWFAKFLLSNGLYYHAAVMNQQLIAQDQKVLGLEHPDTLTHGEPCVNILESRPVEGGRGVGRASHGDEFEGAGT